MLWGWSGHRQCGMEQIPWVGKNKGSIEPETLSNVDAKNVFRVRDPNSQLD